MTASDYKAKRTTTEIDTGEYATATRTGKS